MKEGWMWLSNSPKWHYFRDGRSLCGRFALLGASDRHFEDGKNESSQNCKECSRRRLKELSKP
jgi:hypothetical protein